MLLQLPRFLPICGHSLMSYTQKHFHLTPTKKHFGPHPPPITDIAKPTEDKNTKYIFKTNIYDEMRWGSYCFQLFGPHFSLSFCTSI